MMEVDYFIDHFNHRIHLKRYAGDHCGFLGTTLDKREFTNCELYIENLIRTNRYSRCSNCMSAHRLGDRKRQEWQRWKELNR